MMINFHIETGLAGTPDVLRAALPYPAFSQGNQVLCGFETAGFDKARSGRGTPL